MRCRAVDQAESTDGLVAGLGRSARFDDGVRAIRREKLNIVVELCLFQDCTILSAYENKL